MVNRDRPAALGDRLHRTARAADLCIKELEREVLRKDKALAETAALLVLTKKTMRGDLQTEHTGRGRMIGLEDRQEHARDIEAARQAEARLHEACEVMGIPARTLQRWSAHQGFDSGDGDGD